MEGYQHLRTAHLGGGVNEDGMVSLYFGDGMYAGYFVVAREGDVYCMQRLTCWGS